MSVENPHLSLLTPPVHFVDDPASFDACIETLNGVSSCSVDLEFDKNYYRYGFNLCLIQIAAAQTCFLINPLNKELDLSRLFRLLENEGLKKIVFSFGEDLRLLHSLGCFPVQVTDLNHYVRLLNYPQMSLSNLVENMLGITLSSGEQLSNWYNRPLSDSQVLYAANDVIFLSTLYKRLHHLAVEKGVDKWVDQENRSCERTDYSGEVSNALYKEKEKKKFHEYSWHLYKELLTWRDQKARILDLPAFKTVDKLTLSGLAEDPSLVNRWSELSGIHSKLRNRTCHTEVKGVLDAAVHVAANQSLSREKPASEAADPEWIKSVRKEQSKVSKVKRGLFQPVKRCISRDYGEETSSFVFSNRIITAFVRENRDEMLPYKIELLLRYAEELNINPNHYLTLPAD